MNYYIENSKQRALQGILLLKDQNGHAHTIESVEGLLKSETFRTSNPSLIPIFEKAKEMMKKGETGQVF